MLLRGKYDALINVTWDCFDQSNFYMSGLISVVPLQIPNGVNCNITFTISKFNVVTEIVAQI